MPDEPAPNRTQQFATYIREAVRQTGYDIDGPRGGGKKALADATGMSPSSVGRMLAGQTMPDPIYLEALAKVLNLPLTELLIRSGVISSTNAVASPPAPAAPPKPIQTELSLTPESAARQLGIEDAGHIRTFEAMVKALVQQEQEQERETESEDSRKVG